MSNKTRVLSVLTDFKPHSTYQIMGTLYPSGKAGLFRLSAYIKFLKEDGYDIQGWFDLKDRKMYWYQLRPNEFSKEMYAKAKTPDMFMGAEAVRQHELVKE